MSSPETRAPRLIAVDDDSLVLGSLKGLFTLETDYDVELFDDPTKAVDHLGKNPVDLVISDFLMPQMNGLEFLTEARRLQPDAARILLTGFADKQNAIRAINEVGIYHYLEKPWDNDHLLLLIRNALQEKSLRRQLGDMVKDLDRLAREHTDLSDKHRGLEREMEMAANVQRSLLPENFPQVDGFQINTHYRPSDAVGGDYYDVIQNGPGAIWLIADVSGHGVQAALTSMLLKAIFRQTAANIQDPRELLSKMSAELYQFLPSGMYAAATVLRIEAGKPAVQIANAGLPYPMLLSANSEKKVREIPLAGLPLGMFPGGTPDNFDARELALNSGEVLLVSSDGLGEIRGRGAGRSNDFFQDGPLMSALTELSGSSGRQVVEGIVEKALDYGGAQGVLDDVTVVAVERV
jgi:serine phosphatase RsbU (regulator of sigma subunit)